MYINNLLKSLFPGINKAQTIIADELHMPLHLNGPLAFLNIGCPTKLEVSNCDLQRIELTSPHG